MQKIVPLLFLLFPAVVHAGDVYKCVENSRVTYSHVPCGTTSVFHEHDPASLSLPASSPFPATRNESAVIINPKIILEPVFSSGEVSVPFNGTGYFLDVFIDSEKVKAQIDTGASRTSISGSVASRFGIQSCVAAGRSITANGYANYCLITVKELSFGDFAITNIEVFVMPNMIQEVLIGMDLLKQFHIEQHDKVLTLSK